jgi:hypothetical protein
MPEVKRRSYLELCLAFGKTPVRLLTRRPATLTEVNARRAAPNTSQRSAYIQSFITTIPFNAYNLCS